MKFDAYSALAEIRSDDAVGAIRAIRAIPTVPNSTNSTNSTRFVSILPNRLQTGSEIVSPPSSPENEPFRHGTSCTGDPKTWTGRIVSLDTWRSLSVWEKHGPDGQLWNGITKRWERDGNAE